MKRPVLALTLCVATWPTAAHATEALGGSSELVSDATATRRTQFIQERLDQGTASARWWWYGWLGGYSAAAIAQGAVGLATQDEALRATMLVGAAGSALGTLSVIAFPFPPTHAASELRATNGTPAQQRHALALGSLKSCADAENMGRSWLPHALGVAVAAAQGLVLWIGFDQPVDGAESAAVSLVVSEAQIFTQPMRAVDDLASYERQFSRSHRSALKWRLAPSPRGLAVRAEW
jgi:hypothetical protein